MNGRVTLLALVAAASLCLAGCGATTTAGATTSANGTTALTVGTSPTLGNASLYLAAQDGTFAAHHLSMTPQVLLSGASAVPLLLNGQIQFAAADPVSALTAISKKTPLVIVALGNSVSTDQAKDTSATLLKSDSPIHSAADFAGRTVAVNALNSLAAVAARAGIDAAGGDSSKVKFVELPIPQMVAAVQAGRVDAASVAEPYLTQGVAAGLKVDHTGSLSQTLAGVPQLVYLTSKSYLDSHPDVVKAFEQSIAAANSALLTDPSKIRTIGLKSTTVDPALLAKVILPVFDPPTLTVDPLAKLETMMVRYKLLDAPLANLPSYVYSG
jgi:NitT/TauT family transport system substrate-binding protein